MICSNDDDGDDYNHHDGDLDVIRWSCDDESDSYDDDYGDDYDVGSDNNVISMVMTNIIIIMVIGRCWSESNNHDSVIYCDISLKVMKGNVKLPAASFQMWYRLDGISVGIIL